MYVQPTICFPILLIRYLLPWQCMSLSFSLCHVFPSNYILWSSDWHCLTTAIITALPPLIHNFYFAWIIWLRWLSRKYVHKFKTLNTVPFFDSFLTSRSRGPFPCLWGLHSWFMRNSKTQGQKALWQSQALFDIYYMFS